MPTSLCLFFYLELVQIIGEGSLLKIAIAKARSGSHCPKLNM